MISQNKDKKKEKVEGYKVRWQFFGPFLYLFLFMCIGSVYGLLVTMIGRNTPEEIVESLYIAIYMFGMIIVPFSVLALINRFIGITVCVLNEKGINYKGRLIKWKDITKVEYEFDLPLGNTIQVNVTVQRFSRRMMKLKSDTHRFICFPKSKNTDRTSRSDMRNFIGIFLLWLRQSF